MEAVALGIATNLASALMVAGSERLRVAALGDDQEQALEGAFTGATAAMLVEVARQAVLHGRNWARVTLAVGLGVLGTLSIVVGPLSWLAGGHTVGEFLAGAGPMPLLFAASRVVHLAAVFAALAFMFRPAANGYFRAARSAGRRTPGRTTPGDGGTSSRP